MSEEVKLFDLHSGVRIPPEKKATITHAIAQGERPGRLRVGGVLQAHFVIVDVTVAGMSLLAQPVPAAFFAVDGLLFPRMANWDTGAIAVTVKNVGTVPRWFAAEIWGVRASSPFKLDKPGAPATAADPVSVAIQITIERLVMRKREMWARVRSEDYTPRGFVGLGSGLWLLVEELACLAGLPLAIEDDTAFAVRMSQESAERTLEDGAHPWVCARCFEGDERTPQGVMDVPMRCFNCGEAAVWRMGRHPHRWPASDSTSREWFETARAEAARESLVASQAAVKRLEGELQHAKEERDRLAQRCRV